MDVLTNNTDLTVSDLYAMYKMSMSHRPGTSPSGEHEKKMARFQQNIVKAVERLVQRANHPGPLKFDLAVDVKLKGKCRKVLL